MRSCMACFESRAVNCASDGLKGLVTFFPIVGLNLIEWSGNDDENQIYLDMLRDLFQRGVQ